MDETVSATSVYWVIRYSRTLKAQRYHLLIFASYDGEDDCNGPTRVRTPLVGHNGWWAICGGWVVSGGETTIELRRHPGRSSWTTRDRNRKVSRRPRGTGSVVRGMDAMSLDGGVGMWEVSASRGVVFFSAVLVASPGGGCGEPHSRCSA
ncbi:hypothetical protein J6590_101618 [Homalodisca vitripennis]|nr:hypothetical protein J6590_101618 [Homalodisca vitripennis]